MAKLNAKALGLASGIVWSALIFFCALTSMWWDWGTKFLEVFANIYPGYTATLQGSIIGAFWGFLDGGIAGLLLGWLYNKFTR